MSECEQTFYSGTMRDESPLDIAVTEGSIDVTFKQHFAATD